MLGDARRVLHDVVKLKARDAVLNALAGEMALILAPLCLDVRAAHLWTPRNLVCDALSRLDANQETVLPVLSGALKVSRRMPTGQILRSV